ncbi:DUF6266 family protein [Pedobacter sp. ASV1-7]|uniref:DUF6266 family protein n=1 Tax=Pedobacter sp. ASV1-7 TaxID=3145237 RepID=UPI0032E8E5B3
MGIVRNGILGGFRKKVGNVSGAFFRDLNVIKTLPRPSGKAPTQLQINQRIKFGLVTSFLSLLSDLIDTGFQPDAKSASPMNQAVSYHLKEAVIGVAPDFSIDYTKLKFSRGKLNIPYLYDVEPVAGAELKFTWSEDGIDSKHKDGTDMINVVAYEPLTNRFVMLPAAEERSALEFSLQLPPDLVGAEVYCYFSFSSVKKKKLHSKSVYVKKVVVV